LTLKEYNKSINRGCCH